MSVRYGKWSLAIPAACFVILRGGGKKTAGSASNFLAGLSKSSLQGRRRIPDFNFHVHGWQSTHSEGLFSDFFLWSVSMCVGQRKRTNGRIKENATFLGSYFHNGRFAVSLMLLLDAGLKQDVLWHAKQLLPLFSTLSPKGFQNEPHCCSACEDCCWIGMQEKRAPCFKHFDKRLELTPSLLHHTQLLQQEWLIYKTDNHKLKKPSVYINQEWFAWSWIDKKKQHVFSFCSCQTKNNFLFNCVEARTIGQSGARKECALAGFQWREN